MEKRQWAAPVWSRLCPSYEDIKKDIRYTHPDWGNAGPAVIPETHKSDLRTLLSTNSAASYFSTVKDIQRKFPLKSPWQYSYPLLEPQRTSHRNIHHNLVGNCLDVVQSGCDEDTVVVHVDYSKDGEQAVVASRLMNGRYYQHKDSDPIKDPFFHLEKRQEIVIDQSVNQVASKYVHNDVYVLVRSPDTVHLTALGQSSGSKYKLETLDGLLTSNAGLSSVVPGLWSLVTTSGEVTLHDAQLTKPIWMTQFKTDYKIKNRSTQTFKCDFGRHPLSLFVGNESSLRLYDTRIQPAHHKSLFDIKGQDYVSSHEHMCLFIPSSNHPHVYLVMDECVYVIDDRQPNTPLMYWRHMMPDKPTLSSKHNLNSLEILMLSSSESRDVCMISSEWKEGVQQCHGVSVPRHFPILHNTANFAHSNHLWFTSQVQERLKHTAWMGIASLPHPTCNHTVLFLSLHKCGDLFSHTFQSLSAKSTANSGTDVKQGESILRRWESDVVKISNNTWPTENVKLYDVTHFFNQVLDNVSFRNLENMLSDLPEVKFNTVNICSNNNIGITGGSKIGKGKGTSCNDSKSAKVPKIKSRSTRVNRNKDILQPNRVWNLREQVKDCRNEWKSDSKRNTWNLSLMQSYISDPILDPLCDLPLCITDSGTEDCLEKYIPGKISLDLKVAKLKKCEDVLSLKILSLWLGDEEGKSEEKKGDERDMYRGCDERLSHVLGAPSSTRRPGFQYHSAPVDLSDVSSRLATSLVYVTDDEIPEPYDTPNPSQTTLERTQNSSLKSKATSKRKRKRVDGF